jgi:uncharacterized protein YjbI with pentapeptide repeats
MTEQAPPLNRADPERRRATYKLPYPHDDLVFDRSISLANLPRADPQDAKSTIEAKRLSFRLERKNLDNIVFRECNFHDKKGQGQAEIKRLSFRNCVFKRSIMGTCEYVKVRFIRCQFERCDFSDAEFVQCVFDDCEFIGCTGERVSFDRTEIDPATFLAGYNFPAENYSGAADEQKQQHEREWQESRYRIAGQLFRSNNEAFDTSFADAALRELKDARLKHRLYKAKNSAHPRLHLLALSLEKLNLFLTRGGTSISRLLACATAAILLIPFWLNFTQIEMYGKKMQLRTEDLSSFLHDYIFAIPASGGLFLGFGYGFFGSTSILGAWSLLAISTLGITWYALIVPVLIRKVYR